MNILIVTQYFWPENFRINDLVREFCKRGHKVTVLTGLPNYPAGRFSAGYGLRGPYRETYGGVEVIRCPLFPRGGGGGMRLALNYGHPPRVICLPQRLRRNLRARAVSDDSWAAGDCAQARHWRSHHVVDTGSLARKHRGDGSGPFSFALAVD